MKTIPQNSNAFTLIELLVVIAIIGILAALTISHISIDRSIACKNNLRQISVSYMVGVEDNSGRFGQMPGFGWDFVSKNWNGFNEPDSMPEFWRDYWCDGSPIWNCPTAPPIKLPNFAWTGTPNHAWGYKADMGFRSETQDGGYTFNAAFLSGAFSGYLYWNHLDPNSLRNFDNEGDVQFPSRTPVWGDGAGPSQLQMATTWPPGNWTADYYFGNGYAIPRHGSRPKNLAAYETIQPNQKLPGAINLSYYDGHVELVQLEKLWSQYWHPGYISPAKRPGL